MPKNIARATQEAKYLSTKIPLVATPKRIATTLTRLSSDIGQRGHCTFSLCTKRGHLYFALTRQLSGLTIFIAIDIILSVFASKRWRVRKEHAMNGEDDEYRCSGRWRSEHDWPKLIAGVRVRQQRSVSALRDFLHSGIVLYYRRRLSRVPTGAEMTFCFETLEAKIVGGSLPSIEQVAAALLSIVETEAQKVIDHTVEALLDRVP